MPPIRAVIPDVPAIERRNMNAWEDDGVRQAIARTGRRKLVVSGLLTEACVSFPVLSALAEGYEVFVVADTCGGITAESHALALRRMEAAGATMTSWLQFLLELQRDWTRKETYDGARAIVEAHARRVRDRPFLCARHDLTRANRMTRSGMLSWSPDLGRPNGHRPYFRRTNAGRPARVSRVSRSHYSEICNSIDIIIAIPATPINGVTPISIETVNHRNGED